jgi:hypothetical protein
MPEQHDVSGLGGDDWGSQLPGGSWSVNASGLATPGTAPPQQPPSVLGTNDLQKAIDKFDKAVNKLTSLYDKQSKQQNNNNGGFGGQSSYSGSNNGGYSSRQYHGGSLIDEAASLFGVTTSLPGPAGHHHGSLGNMLTGRTKSGSGGFLGASGTFSGQPIGAPPDGSSGQTPRLPAMGQTSTGGSSSSGGGGFGSYNGGYANGGYSSGGGGMSAAGYGASGVLALASGLKSLGTSNLPAQFAMSSMQQQGTLLAPSSVSNFGTYGDQMRTQAFGSHGQGANVYAMPGGQDASQGYGIIQQMAGTGIAGSNSYGQFGLGGAASFAGANPEMSYTQAAGLAQSMGTAQMSMQMRQLGYGVQPLNMASQGGGANQFGSVIGGMMQRWFPTTGSSTSPQTLAAQLRPGVGVGWANLTSMGMDPTQIAGMSSVMEAYDQVSSRSGGKLNDTQVGTLFQQASTGNKQATATLAKYGVTQSDLSQTKAAAAQTTENQSDTFDSFSSGLAGAATALTQFRQILNSFLNLPGVNQLVGGGEGAIGGGSSMTGNVAGGAEMFGGMALMSRMFGGKGLGMSRLFGGGGSAAAADAGAGAGAGAEEAAVAGGGGAAAAGAAVVPAALTYLGLSMVHNKNGSNWTQQGPGGNGAWWNSFSGFNKSMANWGHDIGDPLGNIFNPGNIFGKKQPGPSGGATGGKPATTPGKSNKSIPTGVTGAAHKAVSDAESQLGVPYVWGGETPGQGFDCSGLVQWSYQQAGVKLPRTSQAQWAALKGHHSVPTNAVQAGDLIFMAGSDGTADAPGHVAMMVSSHQLIQAPQTGEDVKLTPYNPKDWSHAARPSGSTTSSPATTAASSGSQGSSGTGMTSATGSGGGSNSTSEATNISGALGGGAGGVSIGGGSGGSSGGTSAKSTAASGAISKGSTPGTMAASAISALWVKEGGSKGAAANMAKIANAESGDVPSVVQKGQPPNLTGYGLYQITPTSGITQNGKYGNLLNAANNTRAAIALYNASGYHPWTSDPVGAGLAATGGTVKRSGAFIVGERGPEMISLPAGAQVSDAKRTSVSGVQGVAQVPWSAPTTGARGGSSGVTVNLDFASGSIVIQQSGTGAGTNSKESASNSAREIVSKVAEMLRSENIYTAIREGEKW